MIATDEGSSVLLLQFRDFYTELIKLKRLVRSGASLGASGSPENPEGERAAMAIAERLTAVMEQQSLMAGRRGSDYTGFYQQAEYVMAALADQSSGRRRLRTERATRPYGVAHAAATARP